MLSELEPVWQALNAGTVHDPFRGLGWRIEEGDHWALYEWLPTATAVEVGGKRLAMVAPGVWRARFTADERKTLLPHHTVRWQEGDEMWHSVVSPWTFPTLLGALDCYLIGIGEHWRWWEKLGAHCVEIDGVAGVHFAVWAPNAERVSVVGDFNQWHGLRHPMRVLGSSGIWSLFIPGLTVGDRYRFEIRTRSGAIVTKSDPSGQWFELRPQNGSKVWRSRYTWGDEAWLAARNAWDPYHEPIAIYEVHAGSWMRHADGRFYTYRELAERLIPYVQSLGFTHIELLPLAEHPLDESWGYQVTGFYAPTSRYGTPDDLKAFVDAAHQAGIGVILDWTPAHFPKDEWALARFDGTALFEHEDPRLGEHPDWGSLIFNYGRHEVRNFLIANALFWLVEYHFDALRVDAVASMLYLDYSRRPGEWLPNHYGGRENLDAIEFLRRLNTLIHAEVPGALVFAEESTAWPMVSRPVWMGGLGFSFKWNMGWMHDTFAYFAHDPLFRRYHQEKLTFSQWYAYNENFVLALSHDEVVHGKGSLVAKMPGDADAKRAQVRLLLAWQWWHPGKKLLFMGGEFAQWREWSERRELDWGLLAEAGHRGVQRWVADLNTTYRALGALHDFDCDAEGFEWVDCHDAEQSVIAFLRKGRKGEVVLAVLHFTPLTRTNYRVGVPFGGLWRERLNSDSRFYGGSDVGNCGAVRAEAVPWHGFPYSVALTLPPFGALLLQPVGREEEG